MSLLYALTGCFDAPGGNVLFPVPPARSVTGEDLPAAKRKAPTLGLGERPLGPAQSGNVTTRELYRAILEGKPYPVRGLIGFGSNMLLAHIDGGHGRKALAALEFYAHCDLFMTPDRANSPTWCCPSRLASSARPCGSVSTSARRRSRTIQFRPAVVPPLGEARPDTDIVFDLAARLGLGAQFWDGDIEAAYRHQLAPPASRSSSCAPRPAACVCRCKRATRNTQSTDANGKPRGFATPSRRVELYSQTFLDHGYAPLPDFERTADRSRRRVPTWPRVFRWC